MPRGDGTGPDGKGSGGGGGCRSRMSRGGNGRRANPSQLNFCECPSCGNKVPQKAWTPCSTEKCPQCGSTMIRP